MLACICSTQSGGCAGTHQAKEGVARLEQIEVLRDRGEKRVATAALPKEKGGSWSPNGPEERILFNETTATHKLVTKQRGSWFRQSQGIAPNNAGESGDFPDYDSLQGLRGPSIRRALGRSSVRNTYHSSDDSCPQSTGEGGWTFCNCLM